ncbi:MAG: hypothetical protein IJZ74_04150 [Clostridia bacterium]|nr:hypothetical protein [Clostridia bacterium]
MKRMRERAMTSTLTSLYAYIFCMMASQALTDMPVYGGALFMCGRVATVFAQTFGQQAKRYLPPGMKMWHGVLLAVLLLLNLCVLVLYPMSLGSPQIWLLFSLALSMLVRDAMCQRLTRLNASGRLTDARYMTYAGLWHGAAGAAMLVILMYNLQPILSLPMLGGYLLCSLVSYYDMLKQRDRLLQLLQEGTAEPENLGQNVRKANAYTVFERLTTLVMAAMEMTLIVMYTFLAVTAEQMLIRMALAVLTTLVCGEAATWFLRWRRERRRGDPTNLLLVGLLMWLWGLWSFSRMLGQGAMDLTMTYICLALCSVGSTLCAACLDGMEKPMFAVARFTMGDDVPGYSQLRAAGRELATLLGQMLALAALTALCYALTTNDLPRTMADFAARFQPLMVIPALLTVGLALLCALRFPLSSRYMDKVMRLLHIRESGGENPALEKQLESVVIQRHTQPLIIRALMAVIRPFFRHELIGLENVKADESNPIVFLCNHGDVYGPVAGMLFCPVPVRPWSISDITADPLEVAQFSYKHTFSHVRWLGPLRWPVARLLGYVSVWGLQSLECVPVYRNKPRELMTTFRKSVEAMQAGDNLLIFPENPDADPDDRGYEHGKPGELFRGFPMLAQIYYSRTGKRCRFLPMLAHKGMRTITFGTEIIYDPEKAPIDERDRIVDEASAQIQAMYAAEEARYHARRRS